jgi:hypothetical protein
MPADRMLQNIEASGLASRRGTMTRVLSLALLAVALLGATVSGAWAQPVPPVPQVTITGFIDTVTSWSKNLVDSLPARTGDSVWYARNRGRFDVIGQLGSAKAVLGIEIDHTFGTTAIGGQDNNLAAGGVGNQWNGTNGAFDLNTDTQGTMEVKWLYTEFQLPLAPFPIIARIGAQPFAAQYKQAAYANGDFAGVNLDFLINPNVKAHLTYVQIEENLTGSRRNLGFGRGDDWAVIASVEVTPIKGLDIRPIYSFIQLVGTSSTSVRQTTIGGIGGSPSFTRNSIGPGPVNGLGLYENRHTIGVDARWRFGPFSLDPTFFYQFGTRDADNPFGPAINSNVRQADISAFFFDVIGGWRLGPLLLEARGTYISGNRPKDQLSKDVNYYMPLDNDNGFYGAGWGEILSLGIDYFIGSYRNLGGSDSFERYGRQQFAARAIYSLTPSFDLRGVVSSLWTARSVDTDGTTAFAGPAGGSATNAPMTCATHTANSAANPRGAGCNGDDSYVGTEINLGLTWRFAPGLAFDLVGAYLFSGPALDTSEVLNGVLTKRNAKDMYSIVSRIRFSF